MNSRILLRSAAVLGALILLLVVGVFYLDSASGSRFLLNTIRKELQEKMNTEFTYSEGELRIFSGFYFKNLKIKQSIHGNEAKIAIDLLKGDYHFSWLKRLLVIDQIEIDHPVIDAKLMSEEVAEPVATGKPLDIASLIEHPPFQVELKTILVRNLQIHAEGKAFKPVQVSIPETRGGFAFVKNQVQLKAALKAEVTSEWMNANTAMDLDFSLSPDADGWLYELKPGQFSLNASNVVMQTADSRFSIQKIEEGTRLGFLFKTKKIFDFSQSELKSGECESRGELSKFSQEKLESGKKSKMSIDSQVFAIEPGKLPASYAVLYEINGLATAGNPKQKMKSKTELKLQGDPDVQNIKFDLLSTVSDARAKLVAISGSGTLRDLADFAMKNELKFGYPEKSENRASLAIDGRMEWVPEKMGITAKFSGDVPVFRMKPEQAAWLFHLTGLTSWTKKDGAIHFEDEFRAKNPDVGEWLAKTKFEMKGEDTSSSTDISEPTGRVLLEPVSVTHEATATELKMGLSAPKINIKNVGVSEKLKAVVEVHSPRLKDFKNFEAIFNLNQERIVFDGAAGAPLTSIHGLKSSARVTLANGKSLVLSDLLASVNDSMLRFEGDGSGDIIAKDFQVRGSMGMHIPADFPAIHGQKISGSVEVPWVASVSRGRDLTMKGNIELQAIMWAMGEYYFKDLSGRIPFEEKLTLKDGKIGFSEIIEQNPFERVSFERLRPLLQGAEQLSIKTIGWAERVYGPFIGFFSMKQNIIFAHQFDLDLGSGRISGEMFLDTYPKNLQVGILSRMTGLDLGEILPHKFLVKVPEGNKNISARSGLVISLNKGTIDGRIDITEIGGSQLITLINLVDPSYQDEKMNRIRGVLGIAYPTAVAVALADGYMDMDIDLKALGMSPRESLRGVPISNLFLRKTNLER